MRLSSIQQLRIGKFSMLSVFIMLMHTPLAHAQNQDNETRKELSKIQQEIAQQKVAISSVNKKRQQLENQLKKDDLAIAKVAKALNNTNEQITNTQSSIDQLAKEVSQLDRQKQQQEKALATQLRAAYSSGHHDYLKLLLSQDETKDVQRTITYYQYLNKARIEHIDEFKQTIDDLAAKTQLQQQQKLALIESKETQAQQKKSLEASNTERKKTVAALSNELLSSKQQLAKLIAEENNLVVALEKLAKAAREAELAAKRAKEKQAMELAGLKTLKRKLQWPVKGRLSHSFGSQKHGYLKWKGVLLSAPVGREVKTIHNGTVLFSDWLKGYGLVTVVDHGNGYMSLYGHNQTLLKNVGDRVETGEPIALVGQSGGQSQAGLYFEIRHQGKAVNPKLWCK